jgi:hypothetical protein
VKGPWKFAATAVLAPALAWASPELECIEYADQNTLLDQLERQSLCRGAVSIAPVDCYRAADDGPALEDADAIELCRCADSTEPVRCFQEALRTRPDEPREAIRLCSAIGVQGLSPDCRPR